MEYDDDILEHKMFKCHTAASPVKNIDLQGATTIEAAKRVLTESHVDWVFLDDRFTPHRSALETLPMLQSLLYATKVVVISSSIQARHLACAKTLGVFAVIDKFEVKSILQDGLLSLNNISYH